MVGSVCVKTSVFIDEIRHQQRKVLTLVWVKASVFIDENRCHQRRGRAAPPSKNVGGAAFLSGTISKTMILHGRSAKSKGAILGISKPRS